MPLVILIVVAFLAWLAFNGSGQQATADQTQPGDASDTPADQPGAGGTDVANYSLDSIVRAVQQVESGGRQYDADGNVITSSAGAIGIMQLEPATAASLGVNPYDEQQNIQGGTQYLQQLFAQFGDWVKALAAYNWGPGNVERADAAGEAYPTSVQDYAQKVLGIAGSEGD